MFICVVASIMSISPSYSSETRYNCMSSRRDATDFNQINPLPTKKHSKQWLLQKRFINDHGKETTVEAQTTTVYNSYTTALQPAFFVVCPSLYDFRRIYIFLPLYELLLAWTSLLMRISALYPLKS